MLDISVMVPKGLMGRRMQCHRSSRFLVAMLLGLLACATAAIATPNNVQISSDQSFAENSGKGCLAVDRAKRLVLSKGASFVAPKSDKPVDAVGTYFPVVVAPCNAPSTEFPSQWSFSDRHEITIQLENGRYCLSGRFMTSFQPLLDPFLKMFEADSDQSPFAYLTSDLKPNGAVNIERLRVAPDLVVSACDRQDALDYWVYDDNSGMIAGPGGADNVGSRRRPCIAIHGDTAKKPLRFAPYMPVSVQTCPSDVFGNRSAFDPHMRWAVSSGREFLPSYSPSSAKDYFSGTGGLPIIGPLGRCLTLDVVSKSVGTSDCDGRNEQLWRSSGSEIRFGNSSDCLSRESNGKVKVAACNASNPQQNWDYVIADPIPNPKWIGEDVYARILPAGSAGNCLAVKEDPFVDPMRQQNPVIVVPCKTVLPRQTSWFRTDRVLTVRLGLIRFADDDGSTPAMGKRSDEDVKKSMVALASNASRHYLGLGVRFVFDPQNDFRKVSSTVGNSAGGGLPGQSFWETVKLVGGVAGQQLYGRAVIAAMAHMGGGASSGSVIDFEPARVVDPIHKIPVTDFVKAPDMPLDVMGLKTVSNSIGEPGVGADWIFSGHFAHEMGHFLGLMHTFAADHFADTPPDIIDGTPFFLSGSTTCGNARSVTVNGKIFTPDRLNNESYYGCQLGRTTNSFSPLQLGYARWMLEHQLNRYPLVACEPIEPFNADLVECDSPESLGRCQQTAAYFKQVGGPDMRCTRGGRESRAMTRFLRTPATRYLLANTAPGKALLAVISGTAPGAKATPQLDDIAALLATNANLPVSMALNTRFEELEVAIRRQLPDQAETAFGPVSSTLSLPLQRLIDGLSLTLLAPAFVANIPAIKTN